MGCGSRGLARVLMAQRGRARSPHSGDGPRPPGIVAYDFVTVDTVFSGRFYVRVVMPEVTSIPTASYHYWYRTGLGARCQGSSTTIR